MNTHQHKNAQQRAEDFLRVASQFQLGDLATEASHEKTKNLSQWAQQDLPEALRALHEVDCDALTLLQGYENQIKELRKEIHDTLKKGKKIFLCGCGATGRLSLTLEYLWRQQPPHFFKERIQHLVSFMAGGDTALVHALEGFEDFPEYGARQLTDLGFSEGDLLISCTEGGETPFVIGATLKASEFNSRPPFFLYCNPDVLLRAKVERSRVVLDHPTIRKMNIYVGPMALAGSTRMQASTALMLTVGLALWSKNDLELTQQLRIFIDHIKSQESQKLESFIIREAEIYQKAEHVLYHVDDLAITVFTDTTERAPTFSLSPFENQKLESKNPSYAYVVVDSAHNCMDSWVKLLGRGPRTLNWGEKFPQTQADYLLGFDFSCHAENYRKKSIKGLHHDFSIFHRANVLEWNLGTLSTQFDLISSNESRYKKVNRDILPLFHHLQLKMLMNIHSTLVMGRLDRYRQNFMTWVKPTNGKLIDRAARYVNKLWVEEGLPTISYEQIVREIFFQLEIILPQESVVLNAFMTLKAKNRI